MFILHTFFFFLLEKKDITVNDSLYKKYFNSDKKKTVVIIIKKLSFTRETVVKWTDEHVAGVTRVTNKKLP